MKGRTIVLNQPISTKVHPDFRIKEVPINDNGEELVRIDRLDAGLILEDPQYYKQQLTGALEHCYVRESVAQLLTNAAKDLPNGYRFVIWDGYRPYEVQKAIYNDYYQTIQTKYPDREEQEWRRLTEDFVSYPSKNHDKPAPHITGGAVDFTIIDSSGNYLDFGTSFDDFSEKAHTAYYEVLAESCKLSKREQQILNNRRLLYNVLVAQGFTNYYMEWWHFDYGNPWWAQQTNKAHAIYGVANL